MFIVPATAYHALLSEFHEEDTKNCIPAERHPGPRFLVDIHW